MAMIQYCDNLVGTIIKRTQQRNELLDLKISFLIGEHFQLYSHSNYGRALLWQCDTLSASTIKLRVLMHVYSYQIFRLFDMIHHSVTHYCLSLV